MEQRQIAFLGLPGTGKSTYLGTFWHFVDETTVSAVEEAGTASNLAHVQELASRASGLRAPDRTPFAADNRFDVPVRFKEAGEARLVIPDRSGEQLQQMIERRQWPRLLRADLDSVSGILFFVHPDDVHLPLGIEIMGPSAAGSNETAEPFSNHQACTAAQLIDVLENVLEATSAKWPLRVAVMISAFDEIDGRTPGAWFAEKLPAVDAMLRNDPDRASTRVYGVSALGGSLSQRQDVFKKGRLHKRAWVRDSAGDPAPFVEPVQWALGWS